MPSGPILYDGWALAYQPNHPAAIHLLTLLHHHPEELPAGVALPADSFHLLPEAITPYLQPTPNSPRRRLYWEQRRLPDLARRIGAACLHLTSPFPALLAQTPVVVSPCEYWGELSLRSLPTQHGFIAHLRTALGQGGLSRARAILWPEDLPDSGFPAPKVSLSPVVHPAFLQNNLDSQVHQRDFLQSMDLPESYVLYHGPGTRSALESLLAAWSWAVGPLGEDHPLLILGLDAEEQALCTQIARANDLHTTLRFVPSVSIEVLAALYRGCSAVFNPAPFSAWEGSERAALACRKPLVGIESPSLDALVGNAAYLIQPGQAASSRSLGAALITVVVEERVSEDLMQAAQQRTQNWRGALFAGQLARVYKTITQEFLSAL